MRPLLPPEVCHDFLTRRDEAMATCKERVLNDDEKMLHGPPGTIANGLALLIFGGSNSDSLIGR